MLKYLGYTLAIVAFFSLILTGSEFYLLKLEVQGSFDRAVQISSDQLYDYEAPNLPINRDQAILIFSDVLQNNLGLGNTFASTSLERKIRSVVIEDFEVFNVFTPTVVSVSNPLTGEVVQKQIDRPSVQALATVKVRAGFIPFDISMPIYAVSSNFDPDE